MCVYIYIYIYIYIHVHIYIYTILVSKIYLESFFLFLILMWFHEQKSLFVFVGIGNELYANHVFQYLNFVNTSPTDFLVCDCTCLKCNY